MYTTSLHDLHELSLFTLNQLYEHGDDNLRRTILNLSHVKRALRGSTSKTVKNTYDKTLNNAVSYKRMAVLV